MATGTDSDVRVAFIGAGQMATALARGVVTSGLVPGSHITAADPSPRARTSFLERVPGSLVMESSADAVAGARIAVLAVKPQALPALEGLRLGPGICLVSVAAGVPLVRLEQLFLISRIVRAMPNTPALVGAGATAWSAGSGVTADDRDLVVRLLRSVGVAVEVDERLLDAVTGLSGSGPAWVFRFVDALIDGGVECGLPRADARLLAIQTVLGSARMLSETGEHPRVLADRVTSPGGTTARGLRELDERGFAAAVQAAVRGAAARAAELGALLPGAAPQAAEPRSR